MTSPRDTAARDGGPPFRDRTALVTGAGSGIGRALAVALVARGAHVYATDARGEAAFAVARELGGRAEARTLDVRDAAAFQRVADEIRARDGGIDFLFNNAGIGVGGLAHELTVAHWDRVLDVNVRGVVHGIVAVYPDMVRRRRGQIVNVASMAGLGPAPLLAPYALTKHAVVGLSTSLRIEAAAYDVRVSALCPSAIETPILDGGNPADLPPVAFRPNVRRYLTRLGGPPYPVEKLVDEALAGVAANEAIIVAPARARVAWRLGRLAPWLMEKALAKAFAAEREAG